MSDACVVMLFGKGRIKWDLWVRLLSLLWLRRRVVRRSESGGSGFSHCSGSSLEIIALPTIVGSLNVLRKVHRAGNFTMSPTIVCLICVVISSTFGLAFAYDNTVRRVAVCSQGGDDGGTDPNLDIFLSAFPSMFAMFLVVALIYLALMWIDVHIKSMSMQKMSADNSMIEVYKKALKVFAVFFAVVFMTLYLILTSFAVMWTFVICFVLLVAWPIGAMNLVIILTGVKAPGGCCTIFCYFLRSAIPIAFCAHPSKERKEMIASADPNSAAGKFLLTRLRMAEMVEKTSLRVWLALFVYLISGGVYVVTKASETYQTPQAINAVHFAVMGIFTPLHLAQKQVYKYVKYSLRDAVGDRQGSGKVSAGLSVNSSTETQSNDTDPPSEEDGRRLSVDLSMQKKMDKRLSVDMSTFSKTAAPASNYTKPSTIVPVGDDVGTS